MTETAQAVDQAAEQDCPECGTRVRGGGRYVTWCAACDWNVDPEVRHEEPRGRVERFRRSLAHRHGEQLFAELSGGTEIPAHAGASDGAELPGRGAGDARRRSGRDGVLAAALAVAVHGVTVALLAGGLWLLVARWGHGLLPALGGLLIALAVVLRPRFAKLARLSGDLPVLRRQDAPRLFALLDEIAEHVGTTGVRVVVIGADANASVTTYGIRQHRVLRLGLGLWRILSPQERIAVLGHEFGHYAHGDTRRGLLVGSAFQSLATWRYTLAPKEPDNLMDDLVNLLTAPPRLLVEGALVLLEHLTLRDSQRAEYLADASAAHAGGTVAAAGLMDRLLVSGSVEGELRREVVAARTRIGGVRREDPATGLWERVAAHGASIPACEYERLRRVAERRGHQVDSTHPPTHLRHRLLTGGEEAAARIVLDPARSAEVEAELADPALRVARAVVRG
ncbi:M48 family metalloprotease [Streptomyces sp. LMG1-1-1.1]|uniref:M48 family metalloprotease n=1 Tax=Streptomyces sp. LMG1-1-1.1 TaxID=3135245 RepID=UPI003466A804